MKGFSLIMGLALAGCAHFDNDSPLVYTAGKIESYTEQPVLSAGHAYLETTYRFRVTDPGPDSRFKPAEEIQFVHDPEFLRIFGTLGDKTNPAQDCPIKDDVSSVYGVWLDKIPKKDLYVLYICEKLTPP